jgi:hypothetical protein
MEFIMYSLPIGLIVSFVLGYYAVKNKWKIIKFF